MVTRRQKLHLGELFQALDQAAESAKVLAILQRRQARQVLINRQDGAADIANFVRDRAHQNVRILQQIIQAQILAVSQVFGKIDDNRRQAGPRSVA